MQTFDELYARLLKAEAENRTREELEEIQKDEFDPHQLDCLLHPKKYASVWSLGPCDCSESEKASCVKRCLFRAITKDDRGNVMIDSSLCAGCAECIEACGSGKLTASKDILPALEAVKNSEGPAYAMIAPAFIGQFSQDVTPGKLRSAFKEIGFAGMVEVALFADILTLKEALEFDRKILDDKDYMLTSCCCPVWLAMIRKVYRQFMSHVPGAVSPMVACGRSIKLLEPDATTVFIGPCIAKKAEAREPDIADAVDFVLTFEEMRDIFEAFHIDPAVLGDDHRDHSSRSGRIYARTGGVSEAVQNTVGRLSPHRAISVKAQQADGVPACREMLNALKEGKLTANFLEGMGCAGGCVGGPKAILNREEGRRNVDHYGSLAAYETPVDNPFVLELLKRLGLESVESLLEDTEIFTRHFNI
ncbi:Iron only hydrogenase large subunit, C-terminal domain [Sporobacter termitidis DSM 10068]|uniref:Iron only hydrogenase large subunit, C-terminal domain n=1 Tax=Sporobacter termitidis DSM 10068 TaxID=1123282 RepID=A0A1M5Y695_9FIRM|nr:[Fe-Fe] hydrogenase large subunit C-terminal domain-containing protein [Sporobacter termitidis]SHI07512.1 Iron only hydrogenase large subunit, C-terminal domain [Sporobacter termitidis DSM 10068]